MRIRISGGKGTDSMMEVIVEDEEAARFLLIPQLLKQLRGYALAPLDYLADAGDDAIVVKTKEGRVVAVIVPI